MPRSLQTLPSLPIDSKLTRSFSKRFAGRNDLLDFAAEKGIPVTSTKAKP